MPGTAVAGKRWPGQCIIVIVVSPGTGEPSNTPPTVSVVVPAFNEEIGLAESLRAIRRAMASFDRRGWGSELIVCDNNSTDQTAAIARDAGARVVFEPVNQISRARNTGASSATGAWLIFVDADSHPTDALFADVADAIERGTLLAGGSTIRMDSAGFGVRIGVGVWNLISRLTHWAAGSFIVCDRAVFAEAGGFSLDLYAAEELDLFRRLKRIARRTGRRIVIFNGHPLATSDRKTRLYLVARDGRLQPADDHQVRAAAAQRAGRLHLVRRPPRTAQGRLAKTIRASWRRTCARAAGSPTPARNTHPAGS